MLGGNNVGGMMGGLMELGLVLIAGFVFVFFGVPLFNWIMNKFKKK